MLKNINQTDNNEAIIFCELFIKSTPEKRYVFGRNEYADSIASQIDVNGFIDEFTDETEFLGIKIFKLDDVPKDALVVSVVIGRPTTVEHKLENNNLKHLDYFAFAKYSGLKIKPVKFWEDFKIDFSKNEDKYLYIYNLLSDPTSTKTFKEIINFRLYNDLSYMRDFTERQNLQYFEDFITYTPGKEVFVDVGGYDGYTSLEFIKRCPNFKSIHIFEPEEKNLKLLKARLPYDNVHIYPLGLSDKKQTVYFKSSGSTSKISEDGDIQVNVDKLDKILDEIVTFIKIDIEGGEIAALNGARNTIMKSHPKLAICVYHKYDDFWKIPELIFSIRRDYKIYLRHYTEGVDETVMFFLPEKNEQKFE